MKDIDLTTIVGTNFYVASEDGDKVFTVVRDSINRGDKINISFGKAKVVTSAFLNSAFGRLYGVYKEPEIENHLSFTNLTNNYSELLNATKELAKKYYTKPEAFKNVNSSDVD